MSTVVEEPKAAETRPTAPSRLDRPYRLTVDQYFRMGELGIPGHKDRVFLWKGRLVTKMTKYPPHNYVMSALNIVLTRIVPAGWFVAIEQPVVMGDDSVPEPDVTIVRGTPRDYARRQRRPTDIGLLIEAADSSLAEDRGEALEEYAREKFTIYWIVNIPGDQVEVYSDPTGPAASPTYRARRDYRRGEAVPVVLDGREVGQVAVDDILPPPGADRP